MGFKHLKIKLEEKIQPGNKTQEDENLKINSTQIKAVTSCSTHKIDQQETNKIQQSRF